MKKCRVECEVDEDVQLLLKTTDFKAKKGYAGVDWETIKFKYKNIRETFASNLSKKTAHSTDLFTRERIASKIKQIRASKCFGCRIAKWRRKTSSYIL